ncbi:bifunctional metallophosphatase/5'-nucleotidase [Blastococcus sp. KM273128]|uniref:bifunctional metallophosphatase/5'-nucleotidase n=1 Tax=Blastococcus sp. KM273128 TaxID=2570314 RepID=UPI001F2F7487|nr:bifunctional metallophosphatase/5'-nucleotidase [Blastococcus sp. KM273128]MCF6743886.1 bifunctional metallophosphatase/5'-nucleotidase [Blastococcus sp. KM273128]
MPRVRPARAALAVVLLLVLAACRAGAAPGDDGPPAPEAVPAAPTDTEVQVLAINDFHGQLRPPRGPAGTLETGVPGPGADGRPGTEDDGPQLVGGAAHLARTLADRRADFGGEPQDSLTLGAGDMVGASPFVSGAFRDEPAVEVLDALGLDFSAVGNHEFDRGVQELLRLSAAGDGSFSDDVEACAGVVAEETGCFADSTGEPFSGAAFGYLAANVVDQRTGDPVLPPYAVVQTSGGVEIGIVGVVTADTPGMVLPSGIAGFEFGDEAEAANRYVAELQDRGVEAIVLLVHEGGAQSGGYDECAGDLAGTAIEEINAAVAPAVDVVVTGHTHGAYDCRLPDPDGFPRPVVQAGPHGTSVVDLRFVVGADGDVRRDTVTSTAVPVLRSEPDPEVARIVEHWTARAEDEGGDTPVAVLTGDVRRGPGPSSPLGVLVGDAMLAAATAEVAGPAPLAAFTSSGSIRADLVAREDSGEVRRRDVYAVVSLPYTVDVVTVPGATIRQAFEQQFTEDGGLGPFPLEVSGGVAYSYDPARPPGDRVDPCSLVLGDQRVDPAGSYRIALTSHLRVGSDGYTAFASGAGAVRGPDLSDAFVEHLAARSPVDPPAPARVVATAERLAC